MKLVVLDVAGTTIEDDDAVGDAFRAALHRIASVEVRHEAVNAVMGLAKPDAIARILSAARGDAPPALVAAVHEAFVDAMLAHYRAEVRSVDGAAFVFDALHEAGLRVALDTGFPRRIAAEILARTGWLADGRVDTLVTSDEVARGRPHPDMIFEAMHRLGVGDARDVVKVGDTPSDLAQGRRAECGLVVGVTYGTHTHDALARCPHDALIDALPELLDRIPETARAPRGRARSHGSRRARP